MRVLTTALLVACTGFSACGGGDPPEPIASTPQPTATPTAVSTPAPTATPTPAESYCDVVVELYAELDDPAYDVTIEEVGTPEFEREIAAVWDEYAARLLATAPPALGDELANVDRYNQALLMGATDVVPDEQYDADVLRLLNHHEASCSQRAR